MKLVQTLLVLIVITGIAAGLALAGTAQKPEPTAAACCSTESCCQKTDCCAPGKCCEAEGGCQSKTCNDCGKAEAKPAAKSCCSK